MNKKIAIPVLSAVLGLSLLGGSISMFHNRTAEAKTGEQLSSRWVKTSVDTTVGANDFSVVFMGDQQIAITSDKDKKYVSASYDYLAQNASAMNLKMYVNLGDIFDVVDFCDFIGGYNPDDANGRNRGAEATDVTNRYFWQQKEYVSAEVDKLHGANIPVALTMGNHDYEDMGYNYRITKTFSEAFPLSEFSQYQVEMDDANPLVPATGATLDGTHYFGGAKENDIENAYYFFEGNGQKYMVLVLGIHPDEPIIAWANEVVAANSDCKVIVATHAYFESEERYQEADYLWDKFTSLHENILMVTCGHSWTDGRIIKRVDYGVHGNPVYQFMIDTQGEEFGGAGVFAQMIFRENGEVDVAYYAPAVDTYASELNPEDARGRYFMDCNQFTITPEATRALTLSTTGETLVGNEVDGTDIVENYASYRPTNRRWLQNVYSYKNVSIENGKGLLSSGNGYVVYKLNVDKTERIKGLKTYVDGVLKADAAYQVDLSFDGVNYKTAAYWDSVMGTLGERRLDRDSLGARELFIRVLFQGNETSYISSVEFHATTVKTAIEQSQVSLTYDYTNTASYTKTNWSRDMYSALEAANLYGDGVIGTGNEKDHEGAKAYVEYRLEGADARTFKNLTLNVDMRIRAVPQEYTFTQRPYNYNGQTGTISGGTYGFKDTDSAYALRVAVSTDGGNTYTQVANYDNASNVSENATFSISLTSEVENQNDVIVRLYYFGIRWNDVGLKKVAFSGEMNPAQKAVYELGGGVVYGNNVNAPIKDGYAFDGWRLNSITGEKVNASDYANQAVTLYAAWKRIYRVTYVLSGGTNASENVKYFMQGDTLTLSNPTKAGYRFIGWYTAEGQKVTRVEANQNAVLYAIWHPQS